MYFSGMSQQKTPIHQPKKRPGKNKQREKKTRFDSLCQCTHLRNRFGAAYCQMDSCFKRFELVYPCVFSCFTLGEIVQFDSARCSKMAEETPTSHAFNFTKGCKLFSPIECHIAILPCLCMDQCMLLMLLGCWFIIPGSCT